MLSAAPSRRKRGTASGVAGVHPGPRGLLKKQNAVDPLIVTVAPVGAEVMPDQTPYLPITPAQLGETARAIREAELYCNTHRTETALLVARYSGIDPQIIMRGGRDTFAAKFAEPSDIQPIIDAAAKYGAIERSCNAAELVSPSVRGWKP